MMSNKNLARRTDISVRFKGVDITKSIKKYLISITYTDNEDGETDDLQIRLHDREGLWLEKWLQKAVEAAASDSGFTIQASIKRKNWTGNGKDQKLKCGKFELDAVTVEGPPSVVVIKATSLP
ncbi:MAG: hypothetical protein FWH04_06565, partial [Oscillospiraceae bacterium]|nr:hypothetical protein [Oscillospiraceae bacterium]